MSLDPKKKCASAKSWCRALTVLSLFEVLHILP